MNLRWMLPPLALACLIASARAADNAGETLYRERCAQCHEGGVERAPDPAALHRMSVDSIKAALTIGKMSSQGEAMSAAEIETISRFLGSAEAAQPAGTANACAGAVPPPADALTAPHWNGWGIDLAQHRFQPAAMAQLAAADVPRLKLKWAFGFAGMKRADAQPTIVGGRLFVGSGDGKVYALDAKTGCLHWMFQADAPVRTAITIAIDQRGWSAYFGDQRANAYAVDALAGTLRWKTHVGEHRTAIITGAPTLAAGVLYVPTSSYEEVAGANPAYPCCSFRGSLSALDAASGKVLWQSYTIAETPQPVRLNERGVQLWGPSGAGIWSSPTVDLAKRMVYVTTGDSYSDPAASTSDAIMAFRLDDGAAVWSRQMTEGDAFTVACGRAAPGTNNCPKAGGPDLDFGSSAILVDLPDGKRALVAGQKSGVVHAVDPDHDGAILWQRRIGRGSTLGGVQWGSASDGSNVYVALSDVRPRFAPEGTPGAQRGLFGGGSFTLDPETGGGLFALKLESGEIVWHTPHPGCNGIPGCSPAQSAAVTAIPGVVFSGGLDGHLRAYDTADGRIIWDVDTKGEHPTVNGVAAQGGSIDGPGPVVVAGMLYVNSGYAFFGTTPGNVLLAFSVDGK